MILGLDSRWHMEPFRCTHLVPCYGYLLFFDNEPEVAYTGDTTFSLFYLPENKKILSVNVLIMEVSGWDLNNDADVEKVHQSGHIHIRDVVQHVEMFEHVKTIVAFHVQPKYSPEFVKSIVDQLPEELKKKIHVCLSALNNYYKR